MFVMNNYFGLGLDADICLDFHMAREENPNKFNSRIQAKGYYLKTGLRKMMKKGGLKDFTRDIVLEVDGKRVDLPSLEGIVIMNILSWASGANLWGHEKDDKFNRPTHYDGMLEVVGVTGIVHLGQIQSGIRSGVRLAQGGHVRSFPFESFRIYMITFQVHIRMNNDYPVPVQVDGEPWLQPPCDITIIRSALKVKSLGSNCFILIYRFRPLCFENVNRKLNVEIQSQVFIFLIQMMTPSVEIFSSIDRPKIKTFSLSVQSLPNLVMPFYIEHTHTLIGDMRVFSSLLFSSIHIKKQNRRCSRFLCVHFFFFSSSSSLFQDIRVHNISITFIESEQTKY